MDITATIDLLPLRARKQTLKGLVAFLNQSIIGYARAHLRQVQFAAPDEVPTIDLYNDMRARELDDEQYRQAVADMGFRPPEAPIVQVMRLTILREWFETEIATTNEGVAFDPKWDAPFSLENSLDWTIGRAPAFDDAEIKKLAAATGRKFDQLRAAAMSAATDNRKELEAQRDAILDLYQSCVDANGATRQFVYLATVPGADGEPARCEERVVDIAPIEQREGIEALIDELPVQLRWRLAVKLNDLMLAEADHTISRMVRPGGRGTRDAAADVRLIDAARVVHYRQLVAFDAQYGRELDEIADRGIFVAELPEAVDEPIVAAMNAQRAREDAAAAGDGSDDIVLSERIAAPAESGLPALLRRSPRPDADASSLDAAIDKFNRERGPATPGEAG